MAKFTVTIVDPSYLSGITAAREAHNADLPENGTPILTDAEYVQFVMAKAAESYANQYNT